MDAQGTAQEPSPPPPPSGSEADHLLAALTHARRAGRACALATVVATRGSVPRAPGAKLLVFADGTTVGTVGGGRFEALVAAEARSALAAGSPPRLHAFVLRENEPGSFGAVCGGEATVFVEPQLPAESLTLLGAGHCARAIARLARQCGLRVSVAEDRAGLLGADEFPEADERVAAPDAAAFLAGRTWTGRDALVLVNRHYQLDRDGLAAALRLDPPPGYLGMMGSRRKVLRVFDELAAAGHPRESFERVHAPVGLDVGADSPAEIAVSVVAEILAVLRGRPGGSMKGRRETGDGDGPADAAAGGQAGSGGPAD